MADHAFGTSFTWDGAIVAQLDTIGGVSVTADSIEVSSHQSTDGFKEFIAGMKDAGEVPVSGWFKFDDTTGQIAMFTDFSAGSIKTGIVTFPTSTGVTWTFSAFITALEIGTNAIDGAIPFTATVKITGVPTFATATSAGLTTPFFAISESALITPAPANAVFSYVATVLTGIASVTLTPTATSGVIKVNGNIVATGVASSAITLGGAGSNTEVIVTVTETDKAPLTYTILVARAS